MRKIIGVFILNILVIISFTTHAQTQPITLLVLGDSLSAGYRMHADKAWPALVDQQLSQLHIINASSSGETTQGGLQRLAYLLKKYQPDWCLIELGANDGLQGMTPTVTKNHLIQLIEQATKAHCQVILTEIKLPKNYGPRYRQAFNQIYHQLAKRYQIPLLPFFVEPIYNQAGMIQEDRLHPSVKAQPFIAESITEQLKKILKL